MSKQNVILKKDFHKLKEQKQSFIISKGKNKTLAVNIDLHMMKLSCSLERTTASSHSFMPVTSLNTFKLNF